MYFSFVFLTVCGDLTLADKANCAKGERRSAWIKAAGRTEHGKNKFVVSEHTSVCGAHFVKVVVPEDPYFLVGQEMVLTCWRRDGINPQNLYFKRGPFRNKTDELYLERNETAVTLRIPVTPDDVKIHSMSMGYYCYDKRGEKDVCIYNVYVALDYYPKKAGNIRCTVNNWQDMTCSWDLMVQYNDPSNYDVICNFNSYDDAELLYKISQEPSTKWLACPQQNKTSCYWNSSDFYAYKLYVLKIIVRNKPLNISTITNVTMKTNDIVKPAPIKKENIALNYIFDDSLEMVIYNLQWSHSETSRKFLFNLTVTSKCDSKEPFYIRHEPDLTVSYDQLTPVEKNLTDLNPYMHYKLTLRAQALGGSGPWSDPTETDLETRSAVPVSSPYTKDGFFEEIFTKCTTISDCRKIQIFFKPLTDCEKFSNTTKYSVSTTLLNETVEYTSFSAITEVKKNTSSTVYIRAFSEEGISKNYSYQWIYQDFERPNVKTDLTIHYNPITGDCTASIATLKADKNFMNLSHTVVWCKGEPNCEEPIKWYEMEQNETVALLPVKNCQHKYRIGVTTTGIRHDNGKEIATPIFWEPCRYEEGKVPKVSLPDVDVENRLDNTFKVSWAKYSCNRPGMNSVLYYEVSYCQTVEMDNCTCEDEIVTLKVAKLDTSVTVKVIDTIQYGCVWVRAMTPAGFGPKNDKDQFFKVTDMTVNAQFSGSGISKEVMIAIIAVSVAGLVLVIYIICKRLRCLQRCQLTEIDDIIKEEKGTEREAQDIIVNGESQDEVTNVGETEPLMTGEDSGTGSLSNQPSDSGSQTDKVSHGSSDSGIHKNHDNPDALEGLLKDNTSGIYDKMLVSDDYDFGSGSTGGVIIKIEDQDHYACEKIDNDSCSWQSNESINASDMHIELKNSVVNSNCSGQSQEDTINCDKRNVRSEDNNTGVVSLSNIDDTLSESSDVEANHKQRLADIMYVSEDDLHMSVSESNEAPGYSKADKISLDSSDCDIDSALMGVVV